MRSKVIWIILIVAVIAFLLLKRLTPGDAGNRARMAEQGRAGH